MDTVKALQLYALAIVFAFLKPAQVSSASSKQGNASCLLHPWFFWNEKSGICECGGPLGDWYTHVPVLCNQTTKDVKLLNVMCMTYNEVTATTTLGTCPYSDLQQESVHNAHILMPKNVTQLNGVMCGKANREGLLCSKCKPGYGPSLLSYRHTCAKCSDSAYGWFLYFCFVLLPTTLFFMIIVFCQIHTTSASLNLYVFVCQLYSVHFKYQNASYWTTNTKVAVGLFATFGTMWNLDFFRLLIPSFCVSEHISNLQVLSLDYIVAFYPLFLTIILYIGIQQHAKGCKVLVCLWKPFGYCVSPLTKRFNWNPLSSTVHIFASFLMLTSTKLLFVSLGLVQSTLIANLSTNGTIVRFGNAAFYDPVVTIFSVTHLPFVLLAYCICAIFVMLPIAVLVLYPTRLFQKCMNHCGTQLHAVHAFADAFNGCYKNGTNGTQDCRYFAGFYLFLRVFCLLTYELGPWKSNIILPLRNIGITTLLFLFALVSPYKLKLFNFIDSFGLLVLALTDTVPEIAEPVVYLGITYIMLYPVAYLSCAVLFKLNCRWSRKVKSYAYKLCGSDGNQDTEREECSYYDDDQDNLPDRLLNPDDYQGLSMLNDSGLQHFTNSTRSGPTYGAIP